jgi:hypothetical protein
MTPGMRDEDDWVGTPPEGHISRDRAKPDFWREQWPKYAMGAGVLVAFIVLAVLIAVLL